MQRLAGQTIGRYRIIEQAGTRGHGRCLQGLSAQPRSPCGDQSNSPLPADDADFLSRFEREAKVVATLRHPNIVQVYDFDAEDGLYYMVMEFIDGGTLKNLLETLQARGTLMGQDEAIRIILAIGSALKYAHSRNMVHRDVKPGNVMITVRGLI